MPSDPAIFGLAAEFVSADDILRAAERVHAAGYRHAEAYTPFPVEGLSELLGFRRTWIPPVCLVGGLIGAVGAFFVCWYATAVSYTWDVGNRPLNSWPAYIAIVVDAMIGGAFFSALAAMLVLNGLPRLNHPLFNVDAFARATQDRFFLCIEARDDQFEPDVTRSFLTTLQPAAIYAVPK
jgi:hypothetical protein